VRAVARHFPVVCILGARQVGKTTLARRVFPRATYLDLERPADVDRLVADAELTLERLTPPIILDEAQAWPPLFPVLRAMVDRHRWRRCRFVLVGSAQPTLARGVSETLAGRVGFVELDPVSCVEARRGSPRVGVDQLWLRGGYPRPLTLRHAGSRRDWMEGYVRTFIERDLPALGVQVSASTLRRMLLTLAHVHGGLWNASELAASLGVTYHTVNRYLDILEQSFLVRRLTPYFRNIGKRLVRSPRVYLRDSGLLHHLLGIDSRASLETSPRRGASWEGFVIEQIIRREAIERPGGDCHFWRTATGVEVDLLIDRRQTLVPIEIKLTRRVAPDDLRGLRAVLTDLALPRGYLVCLVERAYEARAGIQVLPAARVLGASRLPF
jgi:predicted AAA+ superfamily ATPase